MPDAETLKVIINGGSFGLLAILTVWTLFWGTPMLKAVVEKMAVENRIAVETVEKSHEAALKEVTAECRAERRELFAALAAEREKDRVARHEAANLMQVAFRELQQEIVDRKRGQRGQS